MYIYVCLPLSTKRAHRRGYGYNDLRFALGCLDLELQTVCFKKMNG